MPLSGDGDLTIVISTSMLRDFDVELANEYDEERYREFYPGSLEPRHTKYTPADITTQSTGSARVCSLRFALGGTAGARATILVLTAAGVAFLWSAARGTTNSSSAAWVAIALLTHGCPSQRRAFRSIRILSLRP